MRKSSVYSLEDAPPSRAGLGAPLSTRPSVRLRALAEAIRPVASEAKEALIADLLSFDRPKVLSFFNAHALNLCWSSPEAYAHFSASDVLLRDGIGARILLGLLGRDAGDNLNGTDFIPALLDRALGRRLAVWGGEEAFVTEAARKLALKGHAIVSVHHGFAAPGFYASLFQQEKPDLVLLGMGMPRQESLAVSLRALGERPCLIINGGAVVDFMAGKFPRAPRAMRRLGLEWLFRLGVEPQRLFRRYVLGNVLFLYRVARVTLA